MLACPLWTTGSRLRFWPPKAILLRAGGTLLIIPEFVMALVLWILPGQTRMDMPERFDFSLSGIKQEQYVRVVKEKQIPLEMAVNYDWCKGCGICAALCRASARRMVSEEAAEW